VVSIHALVSKRAQTALLAAAALASVAIAGVRITSAAEGRQGNDEQARPYLPTPAQAAATLRAFKAPPGFHPVRCSIDPEPQGACFARSPSIMLDEATMSKLFAEVGIRPYPVYHGPGGEVAPPIMCFPSHYWKRFGLTLERCQGEGTFRRERLIVFGNSLLAGPRASPKPSTRSLHLSLGYLSHPTELDVEVGRREPGEA
jgi:hypothetical protein